MKNSTQGKNLRTKPGRTNADWERVEFEYRAGKRSLRQIAEDQGITEGAIRRRAKENHWVRDLAWKIAAKAEQMVRAQQAQLDANEITVVEANAQVIADAVMGQRKDVAKARGTVQRIFAKLDLIVEHEDRINELADMLADPDQGDMETLAERMRALTKLPMQVDVVRKLVDALKSSVELERRVLKIDADDTSAHDTLVDALHKIHESRRSRSDDASGD